MLSKSPRFDNSKEEETKSVLGDRRVSCIPKSGLFLQIARGDTRRDRREIANLLSLSPSLLGPLQVCTEACSTNWPGKEEDFMAAATTTLHGPGRRRRNKCVFGAC